MSQQKMTPIHPGEVLQEEFLTLLGLSQHRLALDIGVDPRDAGVLYAPWYDGLVRSSDAGQTWVAVNLPSGAPAAGYNSGSLAADSSGAMYLVNDSGVLFRRMADGTTWTTIQGPWMQGVRILVLDPVSPSSTIYIGSPGPSVAHAFAAKLDPAGSVLWATLLAGSQQDEAHAIAHE